jgi:hypothetical protein
MENRRQETGNGRPVNGACRGLHFRRRSIDVGRTLRGSEDAAERVDLGKDRLSLNRYKEVVYEEVAYDRPKEIVGRLRELERQIGAELASLEDLL